MTQEAIQESAAPTTAAAPSTASRVKAEYRYPLYDLNDSIAVARAVRDQGGGAADDAHLASFLKYSTPRSGTYATRVQAARLFGLIEKQGNTYVPTTRALAILSPERPGEDDRRARAQAFLAVPLYGTVYARYRNTSLPPEVGVRAAMETQWGLTKDRTAAAYRVLMDSADQAGFFDARGGQRTHLIEPSGTATIPLTGDAGADEDASNDSGGYVPPADPPRFQQQAKMSALEQLQQALIEKVKEIPADDLDKIREYIKEIKELDGISAPKE